MNVKSLEDNCVVGTKFPCACVTVTLHFKIKIIRVQKDEIFYWTIAMKSKSSLT